MISAFATVVVFLAITLIFPAIKWTNDPAVLAMEELRHKCRDCEKARQLAYQDFNRNKFRIIFWGLPDERVTRTELMPLLAERFTIQALFGGCIEKPNVECYNGKMKELLFAKFGKDYLHQAYSEAEQRYKLKQASP